MPERAKGSSSELHPHRAQAGRLASTYRGATPTEGPTLGTRDPTPIRHIITDTPRIAEPASTCTLDLRMTAIGPADPDISITGINAGIVSGITGGATYIITSIVSYALVRALNVQNLVTLGMAYLVISGLITVSFFLFTLAQRRIQVREQSAEAVI